MITGRIELIEEGGQLDSDVCIIGGGPAAISIALDLKELGKKILLLTGGNYKETAFNQDLNKGFVSENSSHEPLEQNRRRQFGGGSAAWGGRCLPFEPIDFIKRDWVEESGWPFSYTDLLPFYLKAAELSKIGEYNFFADENTASKEIIRGMDSEYIVSTPIERWSPPINFAKEYTNELKKSKNINVFLNAHVMKICTEFQSDIVSHVEVYMNGKRFKVASSKFILAAGGLENPRLLLSSTNSFYPTGIGNKFDNVGRYYMAHLHGNYAQVCFNDINSVKYNYEKDKDGVYFRQRWWITDFAQKKLHLRNIIFFLDHPYADNEHLEPLLSGVVAAKSLMSITSQKSFNKVIQRLREVSPTFRKHSINFLLNGWRQLPDIASKAIKRIPKRRLPSILPSKKSKYWGVYFQAEQTPCRESRVTIKNQKKDALDMPRLEVDVKVSETDIESIVDSHNLFVTHFNKSGAGSVIYSEEGLKEYLDKQIKSFSSMAHHIGTTRMSVSESNGVVDSNSRVYGIKNLFIAGASVFPTGGHANPTLTIIAQSLRLADYIKRNI